MTDPLPVDRRTALLLGTGLAAGFATAGDAKAPAPPEGYADHLSYAPGDVVKLHVSSAAPYSVEVARLGEKRDVVWRSDDLPGRAAPGPGRRLRRTGAGGRPRSRSACRTTGGPGYYAARLDGEVRARPRPSCSSSSARRSRARTTKILLQLSTNTYNAYTNWGGYSLYAYNGRHKVQGRRVSFDRPQSLAVRQLGSCRSSSGPRRTATPSTTASTPTSSSARSCSSTTSSSSASGTTSTGRPRCATTWRSSSATAGTSPSSAATPAAGRCAARTTAGRWPAGSSRSATTRVYKTGDHKLLTHALEPLPRRPAGEHAHRRRVPVGRLPPQPRAVHGRPRRVHRPPPGPLAVRRHRA